MKAPALILCFWTLSVQGQILLDIGNGKSIVVTSTGAYVPNEWIDLATDSVGQWRKGDALQRSAVLRVSSMAREIAATRAQRDSLAAINVRSDTLRIKCDTLYARSSRRVVKLEDKLDKRGPWAFIGKAAVVIVFLAVIVRVVTYFIKPTE